ncbi:MAG TPA: D-tyrosyl-tRNA(Tyr) deacylase [Polyangiaceae bacterium]|nr:D-tyrosyl-tRNA(Tyr) deacylase [Polyangiaceae bacterium]
MRAVVQRVHAARVEVDGEVVGAIERGLCCFVGAGRDDDEGAMAFIADKIVGLRIFADDEDKMNLSVKDVGGAVLAVSQFTVYGDARKGRRPSFTAAMAPDQARPAFARFVALLEERGVVVEQGRFAADMRVVVDNDGPVTILLDSAKAF